MKVENENFKTYCFDFDGVICVIDSDDYGKRSPNHETIGIMHAIKDRGDCVIIHTGRHILHRAISQEWLAKYKVPHDLIQFGKPVAEVYIDDKALRIDDDKWTAEGMELLK